MVASMIEIPLMLLCQYMVFIEYLLQSNFFSVISGFL